MEVEVICPRCNSENKLKEIESKCTGKSCGYRFKVFTSEEKAKEFQESQPSVEPRYIVTANGCWIIAYHYEETQPYRVRRLSDLIDEKTLKMLLRGFQYRLQSPLTITELSTQILSTQIVEKNNRIHGIYHPDYREYCNKFCKEVIITRSGKEECRRYIHEETMKFLPLQIPPRSHEYRYCWLGLREMFQPIIVNDIPFGFLISGYWQRKDVREDEEKVQEGIEKASTKLNISTNLKQEIHFFTDTELNTKFQIVKDIKEQIESLAKTSYLSRRHERDQEFLREIEAIFAASLTNNKQELWQRLNKILTRLTEFCDFEASVLFSSDSPESNMLAVKSQYPSNFISEDVNFEKDDKIDKLLKDRRNIFNGLGKARIIERILENNSKNLKARQLVICPLDLQLESSILILVNRKRNPERKISMYLKAMINQLSSALVQYLRYSLLIIRLREEQRKREELVTLTVHTLNQYMDGIKADSAYLERLSQKTPVPVGDFIITAQEIDELASGLESKTKELYYSTVINAGQKIECRFDKNFSLVQLLEKCANKFIFFARKRRISVKIEKPVREIPFIFGDEEKLEVAFTNLLHNAIKYSHAGKDVIVKIGYMQEDARVWISISDLGFGIPLDEKERIFSGFIRSHLKDPRRPIPGTGLGLMITKQIINEHNGIIEFTSRKGKKEFTSTQLNQPSDWEGFNTIFAVTLPVNH